MNVVSMKVNQANLVKGLRYSFTNKTTVLGELMQNARRAGASQVMFYFDPETKRLRVCDDGCGIDSIETLLTVAESGWDINTTAEEHPFGIGFLSALFACRHLTVSSKSGCISVATDDVLSFRPVSVTGVADWDGKTDILMQDVNLDENDIRRALEKLALGFPIPVFFNDEVLDNPLSINSKLEFVETDIGSVYLYGFDSSQCNNNRGSDYLVFLQGLPIYSSNQYCRMTRECHVIHLDSASFYARLPDREKLINQGEAIDRIKQVLAEEVEKRLVSIKKSVSENEFVLLYSMMKKWQLVHLLNDVPLVPVEVLDEISDYPVTNTDAFDCYMTEIQDPLSCDEIKARGVLMINDDVQFEGAMQYMFAWKKNALIYNGNLDHEHWINDLVKANVKVNIEVINQSHNSSFRGTWAWLGVCFCDAYRLHVGDDMVEISDMSIYTGQDNDDIAIIPMGDASSNVLKQAFSFNNEFDEFQESGWDADSAAFSSFVVANTSKQPVDAIKRLLPNFTGCPPLYGQSFMLTLDKEGEVSSVTAA